MLTALGAYREAPVYQNLVADMEASI